MVCRPACPGIYATLLNSQSLARRKAVVTQAQLWNRSPRAQIRLLNGHDDSTETPVLVDMEWNGTPRKLLLEANRNGFVYILDRTSRAFLSATQFSPTQNRARELTSMEIHLMRLMVSPASRYGTSRGDKVPLLANEYAIEGKQYLAIAAGSDLFAFALA